MAYSFFIPVLLYEGVQGSYPNIWKLWKESTSLLFLSVFFQCQNAGSVEVFCPPQGHWSGLVCSRNPNPLVTSLHACYCECLCHCLHPFHVAENEPLLQLGYLDTVKWQTVFKSFKHRKPGHQEECLIGSNRKQPPWKERFIYKHIKQEGL